MGLTDIPIASGAVTPYFPLIRSLDVPTVTVNGLPAKVDFAGLSPGSVGIYQINFVLPLGTADGAAQVVVQQTGVTSNTVAIPVKR